MAQPVPVDGDQKTSLLERKKQQARDAARAKAAELTSKAKTDAKSLWYRNRRQLAPVKMAAAVAATGTTGALVAEYADVADLAVAGGTGAFALSGGYIALRRLAKHIPDGFLGRMKTGLAAGCAWCATLPLTGADATEMWLALGLGTVSLSARWWQRIRPGYPSGPQPTAAAEKAAETVTGPIVPSALVMERWEHAVACSGGTLPGSDIGMPVKFQHGRAFPVQLVPGKQTIADARAAAPRISSGLRIPVDRLVFEPADEDDPTLIELRVVDASPIREAVVFDKPGYRNGYIQLGPYADGQGSASFHLYSENGMEGGYVAGSKGSGKSRVLESIAITAMVETPTVVIYLDGQEGASSPLLWDHALWSGGPGDAGEIGKALLNIMGARNLYNRLHKNTGFKPTKDMPGILVIVDECHKVFDTHGETFNVVAREGRKLGVAVLAASQVADLTAFGNGGDALRSNLISGNGIALRTMSNVQSNVFPGLKVNLSELPKRPGYGYTVDNGDGEHRTAQFRARWLITEDDRAKVGELPEGVRTAEQWFADVGPRQSLDDMSSQAAGPAFLERHERAAQKEAELRAMFESGDFSGMFDAASGTTPQAAPQPAGGTATVLTLPSIGGGTIRTTDGAAVPARPLTDREQDLMNLLADGGDWHTSDMAKHLGVSEVSVRKLIRSLGESRLTSVKRGVYRAKGL